MSKRTDQDAERVSVRVGRNGAKIGRPTNYTPEFIDQMLDYFDVDVESLVIHGQMDNGKPYAAYRIGTLPSVRGFARMIGTWPDVVIEWTRAPGNEEFKAAYARCMAHLEWMKGELARVVDRPTGLIFDLKCNHGWRDNEQAAPIAVAGGTKVVMEFVADVPPQKAELEAVNYPPVGGAAVTHVEKESGE